MPEDDFRQYIAGILKKTDLPQEWKDFLISPLPAVIYGAGRQATVVYTFCLMFRKPVFCLMATDNRRRWGYLPPEGELPLYLTDEFPPERDKSELDVIIAINSTHNAAVWKTLKCGDWPRVTTVEDWQNVNAATRDMYFRGYLLGKDGKFLIDAGGSRYVECPHDGGMFKIYYDIDPMYKANLLGEFGNLVLPSLFGDFSLAGAIGPYEHENVRLRSNDCVFDLGASIGLFSCVAAAKGCSVHAFEPTPIAAGKYLRKNAELYHDFTVVPQAVLDKTGQTDLFVNADCANDLNITRHSIFKDLESSYSYIKVNATTVDAYVQENQINRVDFIKSNTEHADSLALSGAAMTLREFSPRLAILHYNPSRGALFSRKIEEQVRRVNPSYRFVYKWNRLFAWVPGR